MKTILISGLGLFLLLFALAAQASEPRQEFVPYRDLTQRNVRSQDKGVLDRSRICSAELLSVHTNELDSVKNPKPRYGSRLFGKPAYSRNLLQDMEFVGKTAVSDVAWIYSSPTRLKTRDLKYLAGLLAVGTGIYLLDDEISAALHRNKDHWILEPIHETGELLEPVGRQGTMNKYIFGTALISYLVGFEWLSKMSAEVLESYLIAGPPKVIVNKVTGRPRPLEGYKSTHWDFFEPGQSFFSGHSSHAFQIARVMDENIHFVPLDILLYVGAASVAIQRVDSRWHWASDVWIGSAYGFAVADALVGRHHMKWMNVKPYSGGRDSSNGLWISFNL